MSDSLAEKALASYQAKQEIESLLGDYPPKKLEDENA